MHWGFGNGMGGWFGGIGMILFWGILILLVWYLIKQIGGGGASGKGSTQSESALDILKKRYARGEISKEEFDRMKQDLLG